MPVGITHFERRDLGAEVQIQLEHITFNFDPACPGNKKLNVRTDSMDPLSFSEWKDVDEFVIAYVTTDGAPREITARFNSPDLGSSGARIEVQAVPIGTNLLGNVPSVPVDFDSDGIAEVSVRLPYAKLEGGVQCCTVAWEWSYRSKEEKEWTPFQTTRQRVYCTLGPPTEPWKTEKPWPAVLEYACRWAKDAANEVEAATKITCAVYDLGKQLTYKRGPTYANACFNCADFLKFLKNGIGIAQSVNCADCATIVSTFANILGCDLEQSSMGRCFDTNFIYLIGDSQWRATGFPLHSVAWKYPCGENDPLYDACLQIDTDKNPKDPTKNKPVVPSNLKFGSGSEKDNDYRFCLVNGGTCRPLPRHMIRRPICKSYLGGRRFNDEDYLRILKARYQFDSWPPDQQASPFKLTIPLDEFLKTSAAFAGWETLQTNKLSTNDLEAIYQITLLRPEKRPEQMVEVYVYICAKDSTPNNFLLQLLAQFNSKEIQRGSSELGGLMTFFELDQSMYLAKYRHAIGLVRCVSRKEVSVIQMGKALEKLILLQSEIDAAATPKAENKIIIGDGKMAHKFAHTWSCYTLGEDGLTEQGHMDLRDMNEQGVLENGYYRLPDGTVHRLSGRVTGGPPNYYLILTEHVTIGNATYTNDYDGMLVREQVSNAGPLMVIAGLKHYGRTTLKAQDDPPWVITKP